MQAIKIATRLGNCAMIISARMLETDKALKALAEYATKYLIWHEVGSEAFNKASDFKRDAEYSDGLSKHLIAVGNDKLSECFTDIVITTSKYDKPNTVDAVIKGIDKMSAEDLAKLSAALNAKTATQPKTEATETVAEAA